MPQCLGHGQEVKVRDLYLGQRAWPDLERQVEAIGRPTYYLARIRVNVATARGIAEKHFRKLFLIFTRTIVGLMIIAECDGEDYHPGYYICCEDHAYEKAYGRRCCGSKIYSVFSARCCHGKIEVSKCVVSRIEIPPLTIHSFAPHTSVMINTKLLLVPA